MASSVGGDLSKIETGPCKLTHKGRALGHTMGGCTVSIKPTFRERKVDEYGEYVVGMISQGGPVTVKTTLMQKSLVVLQTCYKTSYGMISANVVGIGKLPGADAYDDAGSLVIHPLSSGMSTADDVEFYKAVATDVGDVQFGTFASDVVFETTFTCLIDQEKSDGQLIGQIGCTSA